MNTNQKVFFMKDEIEGIVYTIPVSSVVWRHAAAHSRVQWPMWVDRAVNSKRDVFAFTNAEMVMSMAGSAAPTCILKHHSKGYIYAQILEIDTVSNKYVQFGVTQRTIGNVLLWPLSYNQHTIVWNKISDETSASSPLRAFPPIEPDFLTFTNEGQFSGPETRPRPCAVEGAFPTRVDHEMSASDRFAVLLNCTSRYLFRDGKARNERYRRATLRYIEDLPDLQEHKNKLANQSRKRQREDKQEMKAVFDAGNQCTMRAFIKNVPRVIKDLRCISGMPIADSYCATKTKHVEVAHSTSSLTLSLFGDYDNALPIDIQTIVLRRCAAHIFSDTDSYRSRKHAWQLSSVCKTTRSILFKEMASFISAMCDRTAECVQFGSKNNPTSMCRVTYTALSCSPLLLLDLAIANNLKDISDVKLINAYYEARLLSNMCKQVCAARATPNQGASTLTAFRSISPIDFEEQEDSTALSKQTTCFKLTPRFEELMDKFNSQ